MGDGGRRWWILECIDEAALRTWQPDHEAIRRLALASSSMGVCAFARSAAQPHDVAVRAFASGAGIVEDPASGAANGLVAAYISSHEPQGPLSGGYLVSQGREMGHDAHLFVQIDGDDIWVGGRTNVVVTGTLNWPATS